MWKAKTCNDYIYIYIYIMIWNTLFGHMSSKNLITKDAYSRLYSGLDFLLWACIFTSWLINFDLKSPWAVYKVRTNCLFLIIYQSSLRRTLFDFFIKHVYASVWYEGLIQWTQNIKLKSNYVWRILNTWHILSGSYTEQNIKAPKTRYQYWSSI